MSHTDKETRRPIEATDNNTPFVEILRDGELDAVLWDFDGVVADTEVLHAESYAKMLQARGKSVPENFFQKFVGSSEPEIWEQLSRRFEIKDSPKDLIRERSAVFGRLSAALRPNWFVPILLEAGGPEVVHMIISSGNYNTIHRLLARWKLLDFYSRISAVGDPNAKDGAIQHKSSRLREILSSYEVASRLLVIEDSPKYLRLASRCGTRTLGVSHSLNDLHYTDANQLVKSAPASVQC